MHGIGRFIPVSNLLGPIEDAGNTGLETLSFEKPHGTSFVLAQTDINMDFASDPVCNDLRSLHRLWFWATKKLCETEA